MTPNLERKKRIGDEQRPSLHPLEGKAGMSLPIQNSVFSWPVPSFEINGLARRNWHSTQIIR